jgi:hypothetical protein
MFGKTFEVMLVDPEEDDRVRLEVVDPQTNWCMTAQEFKRLKVGNLLHISTARLRSGHFIVSLKNKRGAILRYALRPYLQTSLVVPFESSDRFFGCIRRLAWLFTILPISVPIMILG